MQVGLRTDVLLISIAAFIATIGVIYVAGMDKDTLASEVLVDDALYYAVPARHFVNEGEFALDGRNRSNGVQPLWAIIVVGLAGAIRDDQMLQRAMVLVSGFCWIAAALVMFSGLRRIHAAFATFASIGFLFAGFHGRMSLQGMENGVQALLFAAIVSFVANMRTDRSSTATQSRPRVFYLGLLVALLAMARVESALLAVLLLPAIAMGVLNASDTNRRWLDGRALLGFIVPIVAICGSWAVLSYAYFDCIAPISGAVKRLNEHVMGARFPSVWASLEWHAQHVTHLALRPFCDIPAFLALKWARQRWSPESMAQLAIIPIAIAMVGTLVVGAFRARTAKSTMAGVVLSAILFVFVVVRLAAFAVMLPHYTDYATWYFAPEVMVVWVVIAVVFGCLARGLLFPIEHLLRRVGRPVALWPWVMRAGCIALIFVGTRMALQPLFAEFTGPHRFVVAAEWVEKRLPPGQRISAHSAGFLAAYAPHHAVSNLDGLINSREYFERYYRPKRIPDFIRDQSIRYFADYATRENWRKQIFFQTNTMELVKWWAYGDRDGACYGLWRFRPAGEVGDILDPSGEFCDRLSQIQFAAEVLGRFRVVDEADLPQLRKDSTEPIRVITSIAPTPDWTVRRPLLRHVVVSPSQARELALRIENTDISTRIRAEFAGTIRLLGIDVPVTSAVRGGRASVTRFWSRTGDAVPPEGLRIEMRLERDGASLPPIATPWCYETYAPNEWSRDELVADTIAIDIPPGIPLGDWSIALRVSASDGGTVTLDSDHRAADGWLRIASVRIRW